jgi:hypothetical protein
MVTPLHIASIAALLMGGAVQAAEPLSIDVYRDANCGCCKDWIKHLQANGFEVKDHVETNMSAVKQRFGVTPGLASCHTGVIDGKFVEGHVPAAQILELNQRTDLLGIAVPGMPAGSPGMDYGQPRQAYQVIGLSKAGGEEVLAEYAAGE